MTYRCQHCGFVFIRFGPVRDCPSCGQSGLRAATPEESARLRRRLEDRPVLEGERSGTD